MMSKFQKYIQKAELDANCTIRMGELEQKVYQMMNDGCFNLMQNYARYYKYWKTVQEIISDNWTDGHYAVLSEQEYIEILMQAEYTCSQEDDNGLEDYVLAHQTALEQLVQ